MHRLLVLRSWFVKNWQIIAVFALALLIWTQYFNRPFTDNHSWRQSDVAQVARNFYLHGHNILLPEINWNGDKPGYVETELPLVPWLASLLYVVTGVHEWAARVIPVLFSLASVYYLYCLAKRLFDRKVALFSALFFLVSPLSQFMGQAFMTEPAMVAFSIAAVYYFERWLSEDNKKWFLLAVVCWAFAIMVKAPTLYMGLVFLYLLFEKQRFRLFLKPSSYFFVILSVLPGLGWYLYAHFHVFATYHNTFIFWTGTAENDKFQMLHFLTDPTFYFTMLDRLVNTTFGPFLLAFAVMGGGLAWGEKKLRVFVVWIIAIGLFVLYGAHANMIHNYYQLPLVPPVAVLAGYTLAKLVERIGSGKAANIAVGLVMIFSLLWTYQQLYGVFRANMSVYFGGQMTAALSAPDDLVITHHDLYNPALLYYTDRYGWPVMNHDIGSPEAIEGWRERNVKFMVSVSPQAIPEKTRTYLFEHYQAYIDPQYFVIFDLRQKIPLRQPARPAEALTSWDPIKLVDYAEQDSLNTDFGRCHRRTYTWQTRESMAVDYVLFMHYLRDGEIVFQQDYEFGYGSFSTTLWSPRERYSAAIWLCNPPNIPAGEYTLDLGWYDPITGTRLQQQAAPRDSYPLKHYSIDARQRNVY